jgi:hypothetical protein
VPTPFDVAWTALVNASATGNTVEKTSGGVAENSRARSVNVIYEGPGFVEWQFPVPGLLTVGLNSGPQALSRSDVEFALSTIGGLNVVEVREGGVYKGDTSYSPSDVFRIEILGTQVLYKKNGVTFYVNSGPALVYPFQGEAVLISPGAQAANARMTTPAATNPRLVMEDANPTNAAAVDSVTFSSGPFPLTNNSNFSADRRTRVMLFAVNFDLLPGEDFHGLVEAHLENQQGTDYVLPVEYVGKVPGFDWLTAVVVRLDEQVTDVGDLTISLRLRGVSTNIGIIKIQP